MTICVEAVANRDINPISQFAQNIEIDVKSKIIFCKYVANRCKMQNPILQIFCKSLNNAKSNFANILQIVVKCKILLMFPYFLRFSQMFICVHSLAQVVLYTHRLSWSFLDYGMPSLRQASYFVRLCLQCWLPSLRSASYSLCVFLE